MTATLDTQLTDTTPDVTSITWDMAPSSAYLHEYNTDHNPGDMEALGGLPFLYDDGTMTAPTSLEIIAGIWRETGTLAESFPEIDTFSADPIMLTSKLINIMICLGRMAWDAEAQTLRVKA